MRHRLRPAELLIAAGALLLFVATFLPWFTLPSVAEISGETAAAHPVGGGRDSTIDLNVWDLALLRWWVYLSIFLAVCLLLAALLSRSANWATVLLTPLVLSSLVTTISLSVRLFDHPRPFASVATGLLLAVAGTWVMLVGTLWGLRDDSTPAGFERPPRPELIDLG